MPVWTSAQIEMLRTLAKDGASAARIAARLNRSIVSVKGRARKLGIEIKSTNEVRKANGLSSSWVANRDY